MIDDSLIQEPYFMVTPFWKSKQFNVATGQPDFIKRGIVGFIRSSPLYKHQYCSYISRAYFNGEFPENYEHSLEKLSKLNDKDKGSIVSCILNDYEKPNVDSGAIQNSFIDVLLAYVHSPLQTRKARVPMKSPEAQEAFNYLLGVLPFFYFIQKVQTKSHPKRVLVSINFHSPLE